MAINLHTSVEESIAKLLKDAGYPQGSRIEPYRPTLQEMLVRINKASGTLKNPLSGSEIKNIRIFGEGCMIKEVNGAIYNLCLEDHLHASIFLANLGWNAGAKYPPRPERVYTPRKVGDECYECGNEIQLIPQEKFRVKVFFWTFSLSKDSDKVGCLYC